ncbi:MAG: DUF1816 domain-containing protein [Cyanothece sp. SIO1E1]|nr:DUF1816 domain-containing protein [Cyanothece sp. SIO1E1]
MKESLTGFLNVLGLAYWIEIVTDKPQCTYYFGPFANANEANEYKGGYIEDLQQEGAQGIQVAIKRCKPERLTIFDESAEVVNRPNPLPAFSGQS